VKVLLDADVLLDVALDRVPFADESSQVVEWCQKQPLSGVVAWHTVSNVYYVLRSARNDAQARRFVQDMLRFAAVVSAGSDAVHRALSLTISDFEDALQVAVAMAADARLIITRNVRDYRNSAVPPCTPHEFLTRVEAS
jgi:predicted nucleic acid-binding protein